ncbi:integrase [Vibrio cholerae]|nr:integrase [Vibrio cholerae]AOY49556.1 integrase [Vibrio cholerae]QHQ92312.1 hypothetical protein FKV26_17580 [Vibrio cholerae O1]
MTHQENLSNPQEVNKKVTKRSHYDSLSLSVFSSNPINPDCSGQLKLATVLEFSQYNRSDSLGVRPPLY